MEVAQSVWIMDIFELLIQSELEHSTYGIGYVQAKPRCVVVQRLPMNQRAVSWLANPGEGGMPAKVRAVEGPRNGPLPR